MAVEFESNGSCDECSSHGACVGFGPDDIGPVIAKCLSCLGVKSFEEYVEKLRRKHGHDAVRVYGGQVFVEYDDPFGDEE